jgi:hypothetical protein
VQHHGSQRGANDQAALEEARASVNRELEHLEMLCKLQPSQERHSLRGSAYKRLALIARNVGDGAAEDSAVEKVRECYAGAETLAVSEENSQMFYAALNRIGAEIILGQFRADTAVAAQQNLAVQANESPDFWCIAGQIELKLYLALVGGALRSATIAALCEEYLDLHSRVSEPRKWRSVYDQAQFVLESHTLRAQQQTALTPLLALLESFAHDRMPHGLREPASRLPEVAE